MMINIITYNRKNQKQYKLSLKYKLSCKVAGEKVVPHKIWSRNKKKFSEKALKMKKIG